MIKIGKHQLRNPVFFAPMSGISDAPTRDLAWQMGAGAVVSEMVASEAFVTGMDEMLMKAARPVKATTAQDDMDEQALYIVQLAGREARWMAESAKIVEDLGADVVDINMGCPARRVTSGYSGSALMRDLDHALTLIEATVSAVKVPVTLKMRLGWDEQSINAPELAKRAEGAGIQLLTVHGRTRNQFYEGRANWRAVKAVKTATSLPLIVNGDILNAADAHEALKQSGADGVMIGRGASGKPWVLGQVAASLTGQTIPKAPGGKAFYEMVIGHYNAMIEFYGENMGNRQSRKHLAWYFEQLQGDEHLSHLRQTALTSRDVEAVRLAILEAFNSNYLMVA